MLFDWKVCYNKMSDYLAVNGYVDYDDGDAYYLYTYYGEDNIEDELKCAEYNDDVAIMSWSLNIAKCCPIR